MIWAGVGFLVGVLLWWAYQYTLTEEECQAELDAYVAEKLRRELQDDP